VGFDIIVLLTVYFRVVGILELVFQRTHGLSRSKRPRYTPPFHDQNTDSKMCTRTYTRTQHAKNTYCTILRRACMCVLYGHHEVLGASLTPSARSSRTRHDSCRGSRTQWLAGRRLTWPPPDDDTPASIRSRAMTGARQKEDRSVA
jgi:hypothetical protein